MNRDNILKALKKWINNYDGKVTNFSTLANAYGLIEKLTEENKRIKSDTVKKMAKILLDDIYLALESNYKVIKEHADKDCEPIRELVNRVKGKIDALRGLEDLIYKTGDAMLEGKK